MLTRSVDAGKSTMLGVLVKGNLDDGRGKARVNLFRHKHEIESGRTSSVGMEIMGFDTHGEVIASNVPGRKLSWEEIGNRSVSELINFFMAHVFLGLLQVLLCSKKLALHVTYSYNIGLRLGSNVGYEC